MFENRVLRKIFGSKRDEVTGDWRRLHNEGLYALYSSPIIIGLLNQKDEVGLACSTYGNRRFIHKVMVGKAEGKRPLGRPRRR